MTATIDLSQGVWRFHQVYDTLSYDQFLQTPVQEHGTSTAVLLRFTKHDQALEVTSEGLTLAGEWYEGRIESAGPSDNVWGVFRAKVFPAIPENDARHQVIEVFHTEYIRDRNRTYTNQLTIYSGILVQRGADLTALPPPRFFGHGADNSGRGWMTFGLAPQDADF